MNPSEATWLTERQVADRTPFAVRTLQQWRYLGKGPRYIKTDGRVYYRWADIEAYMSARIVDPAAGTRAG